MISGPASLITPSWNQVVGLLTEWRGFGGWRPDGVDIRESSWGSRSL